MDAKTLGDATLHGWKDSAATQAAHRAPVSDDLVRAALGMFFFAASLFYVVRTLKALTREAR